MIVIGKNDAKKNMVKISYSRTQPSLSTLVSKTFPSYFCQDCLTSSIESSLTTATNEEPVPDNPEAKAPASRASTEIDESNPNVAEYISPFKFNALR